MSTRPTSEGQAVFTIVSANYIALAATLMQSVRDHNPGTARFIVLVDAMQDFPKLDLAAELLPAGACGIAGFGNMALWYDVMELNTAVKPSVFLHLFGRGFGQVAYLDPDILVKAPLQPVWNGLDGHSCVLTPHHLQPLQDGRHPNDLAIMKSGVYNLGFLGLRNDEDAVRLARWWADRLLTGCRVDLPGHMFTDQRWMDLAPAFVPRTLILRHPGCNLAYWNLPHREVRGSAAAGFTVDGQPLVFAHFSGIKPDDPRSFSKHQDRYTADTLPPAMAELCAEYRSRVMRNGWARTGALPYAYSRFPDGRRIEPLMRRWLLRTLDAGGLDSQEPVGIPSDFFDHPEDGAALGAPVTRLMYQLWLDRLDLQTHFPVATPAGAAAYRSWFLSGEAVARGVDPRSIAAARRLGLPHSFPARQPPWPRVAGMVWSGPAAAAGGFLAEDVRFELDGAPVLLPRGLALAWERRADLQHHFPLRDLGSLGAYVGWCLTSGLHDGVVAPDMISDGLVAWLTEVTPDAGPAEADVPLTRALMLIQGCKLGREVLPPASGFPGDRTARLSHALWFAYLAPALLRWPDALVAPVRAWFARPSEVSAAGFTLNRAALVLWLLRRDVAAAHPMFDESSRQDYLLWLLLDGLRELGLGVGDLDPALARQLTRDVPRMPGVPWFAKLLYGYRADLRDSFDLATAAGRRGLMGWCSGFLQAEYGGTPAGQAMFPPAQAVVPVRAALALTGCWTGQTGIGEHLRGTAAALRKAGFDDFVVLDAPSGRIHRADGTTLPDGTPVQVGCNILHMNAETALEDWSRVRRLKLEAGRTVGWWAWELEALPARWLTSYSYIDELWAISAFTADALRLPGLRPVRVVPQSVALPDGFRPGSRASYGFAEQETVFLFMFDPHSFVERKNPQGVVRAFVQAFPAGDEPVRLVIKMHHGADFPELMATLRASSSDPRVEIRDEYMDREDVLGLMAAADAFVSLHRSEGFGRGPAEAMLLGKPVILTDYSGTQDFADADVALLVPTSLVLVAPDEYIGVEGQRWAEPDVAAAAAHMRWVVRHPAKARALGTRARARIKARHGPLIVGRQVLATLGITPRSCATVQANKPVEANALARSYPSKTPARARREPHDFDK